jgi:hypothetical protein
VSIYRSRAPRLRRRHGDRRSHDDLGDDYIIILMLWDQAGSTLYCRMVTVEAGWQLQRRQLYRRPTMVTVAAAAHLRVGSHVGGLRRHVRGRRPARDSGPCLSRRARI